MKGIVNIHGFVLHGKTVEITEQRHISCHGLDLGECYGVTGIVNGCAREFWLGVDQVRVLEEAV